MEIGCGEQRDQGRSVTDAMTRWQVSSECTELVTRLYLALDEHDYEPLDELFSPDAELVRLGQRTVGLAAIRALMHKRPADLATRHVITNPIVRLVGEDYAQGSFYMLVVRKSGVTPTTPLPLPVQGPWRLSVVRAGFRPTEDGWRIATQRTDSQFEFTNEVVQ
jgi:hypothetical protein